MDWNHDEQPDYAVTVLTMQFFLCSCTVEDAAIYQVSARNSKGIVSCSGVLEVGAMNEYQIHQRFFAKLKQKAELKRRELEESRRRSKENIQHEQLGISQERTFRKLRSPDGPEHSTRSAVQDGEENEAKEVAVTEEQPEVVDEVLNGLSVETQELSNESQENDSEQLNHVHERESTSGIIQATKEKQSRKVRISNGFDEAYTNQPNQDTGGGRDTSGGLSLAKYLAESLQSQVAEEQEKTQALETTASDNGTVQGKDRKSEEELERKHTKTEVIERKREVSRDKERERSREREREKSRQPELEHKAADVSEAHLATHKESEHQHKSTLSSVFHSLKGIFFGKGKKSSETGDSSRKFSDISDEKQIPFIIGPETDLSQTQPQEACSTSGVASEQSGAMEVDQLYQTGGLSVIKESPQQLLGSVQLQPEVASLKLNNHSHGFTTNNTQETQESTEENGVPETWPKTPWLSVTEVSLSQLLFHSHSAVHLQWLQHSR